jgi:hypothetical protein
MTATRFTSSMLTVAHGSCKSLKRHMLAVCAHGASRCLTVVVNPSKRRMFAVAHGLAPPIPHTPYRRVPPLRAAPSLHQPPAMRQPMEPNTVAKHATGRHCSICERPDLAEIETWLAKGNSLRKVATMFGTTASALFRHQRHVPPAAAEEAATAAPDAAEAMVPSPVPEVAPVWPCPSCDRVRGGPWCYGQHQAGCPCSAHPDPGAPATVTPSYIKMPIRHKPPADQ